MKVNQINNFYSGFCLTNEEYIFSDFIIKNDFTISGFSYGAQIAFEYVLNTKNRVDLLQLFSPAFFQNQDIKYKRLQLLYFEKNQNQYCKNFLLNIIKPNEIDISKYFKQGSKKELEDLLFYEWKDNKLKYLLNNNIKLEVYLGVNDIIIDSKVVKDFFKKYGDIYYIKNVGHTLK